MNNAHEQQVATALHGIHPDLTVRRLIRNTVIYVGRRRIGTLGPQGFRVLPSGPWQTLRLSAAPERSRIRALLTEASRSAPVVAGTPARSSPTRRSTPGRGTTARSAPGRHDPQNWAAALQARGVPAELQGSEVVVAGIGPLPVPEPQTILKNAARRFVGEQTRAVMPALASVLTTALQPNLVGVETATTKRSVIVRVNGHQVATANRFRITITGSGHLDDPLHNPEAAPRLRAAVDRARVDAKRARDDRVRANVQIVRSQAVSKPKRVKTAAVPRAVPEKADLRFALPTTLPATARERATRASQRLRSERTLVPAVWLEVTTGHGTLRFEPISEAENPLEARFTFAGGGARFSGALRLKRPDDPLTLRVDNGSAEHLTGQAWAAALIVYSHLTCVGLPDAQTREPQAARCPPQLAPRAVGATPTSRRSRPLRMDAGTARERQSIDAVIRDAVEQTRAVSGHLRRLAVGARASPEAIRAGERAGIRVPPGHTWVRPHGWWADEVVGVRWPHEARLW